MYPRGMHAPVPFHNLINGRWYFGRVLIPTGIWLDPLDNQFTLPTPNWLGPFQGTSGFRTDWGDDFWAGCIDDCYALRSTTWGWVEPKLCVVPWPGLLLRNAANACEIPDLNLGALNHLPIPGTFPAMDPRQDFTGATAFVDGDPGSGPDRMLVPRTAWFASKWTGPSGPNQLDWIDPSSGQHYWVYDIYDEIGRKIRATDAPEPPQPIGPQPTGWPGDTPSGAPKPSAAVWPWLLGGAAVLGIIGAAVYGARRNPVGESMGRVTSAVVRKNRRTGISRARIDWIDAAGRKKHVEAPSTIPPCSPSLPLRVSRTCTSKSRWSDLGRRAVCQARGACYGDVGPSRRPQGRAARRPVPRVVVCR